MTSIRTAIAHPQFRRGVIEMAPLSLGVGAWGLVTGVAMVKAGMSVGMALLTTFTVYAGSVQLAAVPLMAVGAPLWMVLATAFCVNLRFVIFSAQWRPYFIRFPRWQRVAISYFCADLNYVVFMRRHPEPQRGTGQMAFFCGATATTWLAWQVPSVVGIVLADVIPGGWGLGFAGVLALLGLGFSLLSDRATLLAAVVAASAAVAAFAMPFHLYIVVAIAAAVCVGLTIDRGNEALRARRGGMAA